MGKIILLVEDESELQNVIKVSLEMKGYQVLVSNNGKDGLQMARACRLDLIISDVMMPVMDGFAFYKELKEDSRTANIPIIILTARDKMADTFFVVGAEGFIAKPFEENKLLTLMEKLISEKKKKDAAVKNMKELEALLNDEDDE